MGEKEKSFQELYATASGLLQKGEKSKAKEVFLQALENFPKDWGIVEKAVRQSEIGKTLFNAGFEKEGRALIKKALLLVLEEACKKERSISELESIRSEISATAAKAGLKKEAKDGFMAAIESARKVSTHRQKTIACKMASSGLIEEALEQASVCKNDFDRVVIYSCIVSAYAEQEEFDKAIGLMPKLTLPESALIKMAKSDVDESRIPRTWAGIAEEQAKRGLKEDAKKSYEKAIELIPGVSDPFSRTFTFIEVAGKMCEFGFRKEANEAFRKAIQASKETGDLGWRTGVWKNIHIMQKEHGYEMEAKETAELIEEGMSKLKEETHERKGATGISFIRERASLIFMGVLVIFMLVAVANISFINTHLDSDLALILVFVLPLICDIGFFLAMASGILKRLAGILGLFVIPLVLPLIMLILMLSLSSSFLSIVAGSDSADLLTSVKAIVLLLLIPPFAINLFVAWILVTQLSGAGGVPYSGVEAIILPLLYPIFAAIGAILGAVGFFLFG